MPDTTCACRYCKRGATVAILVVPKRTQGHRAIIPSDKKIHSISIPALGAKNRRIDQVHVIQMSRLKK